MLTAIKQQRELLDYSQEYMATKLHASQNTYRKIELGNTPITIDRLWQICEILDLNVNELIGLVKASISKDELMKYQLASWQR